MLYYIVNICYPIVPVSTILANFIESIECFQKIHRYEQIDDGLI